MDGFAGSTAAFFRRVWRIIRWPLGIFIAANIAIFLALFVYELYALPKKEAAAIEKINAAKLTMRDVDGSNLPPIPDPEFADATIEGVDANHNDIRDDVELAIFKRYRSDIRVRAAALQYALTQQLFLDFEIQSASVWGKTASIDNRAFQCFVETARTDSFEELTQIESLVKNTPKRQERYKLNERYQTSFGLPPGDVCDVKF